MTATPEELEARATAEKNAAIVGVISMLRQPEYDMDWIAECASDFENDSKLSLDHGRIADALDKMLADLAPAFIEQLPAELQAHYEG